MLRTALAAALLVLFTPALRADPKKVEFFENKNVGAFGDDDAITIR